jgi:hypothetical protein
MSSGSVSYVISVPAVTQPDGMLSKLSCHLYSNLAAWASAFEPETDPVKVVTPAVIPVEGLIWTEPVSPLETCSALSLHAPKQKSTRITAITVKKPDFAFFIKIPLESTTPSKRDGVLNPSSRIKSGFKPFLSKAALKTRAGF